MHSQEIGHLYNTRSVPVLHVASFCFSASRSIWSCSSCCSTAAGTKCGWLVKIWDRNCPVGDSSCSGATEAVGLSESKDDDALIAEYLLLLSTHNPKRSDLDLDCGESCYRSQMSVHYRKGYPFPIIRDKINKTTWSDV